MTPELSIRAKILAEGGQELWDQFMDELREQHLGLPRESGAASVFERLEGAYQTMTSGTS